MVSFFLGIYSVAPGVMLGLFSAGLIVWTVVRERLFKKRHLRLQKLATPYLQSRFDVWMMHARQTACDRLRTVAMVGKPAWELLVLWPISTEPGPVMRRSWHPPSFSAPSLFGVAGYYSTERSLIVVPAVKAELREKPGGVLAAIVRGVKEAIPPDEPMVDLVEMAIGEALGEGGRPYLRNFVKVDVLELFYSDMSTIEYTAESETIGRLTVATTDGRRFTLRSVPELSLRVRETIGRMKKRPQPAPEPVHVPASQGSSAIPPDRKTCPMCAEEVRAAAKVCRYCGYRFMP